MKLTLSQPIEFGKDNLISELDLKPTARAFKEFALPMKPDGGFLFQPYDLAVVGMKMAGHPAALADKLSVEDMNEIAQAVIGFFTAKKG